MDLLQKRERDSNSDLRGIKIMKIGPQSRILCKMYKVQIEHEWT